MLSTTIHYYELSDCFSGLPRQGGSLPVLESELHAVMYKPGPHEWPKCGKEAEQLRIAQGLSQVHHSRVGVKYSTCTWYLYLSTYLSVLDVLEYLVYGNVKVLVLVLVLVQKVLGTYKQFSSTLKSVKIANYLNTLL